MPDTPKKVLVRALEPHAYDGKDYDADDVYEAEADHVDFLIARHWARPDDTPAATPKKKKG